MEERNPKEDKENKLNIILKTNSRNNPCIT